MKEKSTGDLCSELMSQPDLDTYLKENEKEFDERSVGEILADVYEKKSISKAALARQAGMSEVYLHQVFAGRRKPSRDRLLCLCIGMEASMAETQQLLKQAAYAQIYPRNRRDAIISYGILHHISLNEINDKLFAENEKTLRFCDRAFSIQG